MKTCLCLMIAAILLASASIAFPQAEPARADTVAIEPPQPEPTVSLNLQNAPVQQALESMLKSGKINYLIDPGLTGTVTVNLNNIRLTEALDKLGNMAGFKYTVENGVWRFACSGPPTAQTIPPPGGMFVPGSLPTGPVSFPTMMPSPTSPNARPTMTVVPTGLGVGLNRTFDITFDQAIVYEALGQLMELAGQNYVFDLGPFPTVQRISAKMRGISLSDALDMLAASSNLQIQLVGNTYVVRQRQSTMTYLCPRCGLNVIQDWKYCPRCGTPVTAQRPPGN
jgi:ribosomal protein S27AE